MQNQGAVELAMEDQIAQLISEKFFNSIESDTELEEKYLALIRLRTDTSVDLPGQFFKLAVQYAIEHYDWAKAKAETSAKEEVAQQALDSLDELYKLSHGDVALQTRLRGFAHDLKVRMGWEVEE